MESPDGFLDEFSLGSPIFDEEEMLLLISNSQSQRDNDSHSLRASLQKWIPEIDSPHPDLTEYPAQNEAAESHQQTDLDTSEKSFVQTPSPCFEGPKIASSPIDSGFPTQNQNFSSTLDYYGKENIANPSLSVKEERFLAKTQHLLTKWGIDTTDIEVIFNRGPWSDFYGATKYCNSRQCCMKGPYFRWSYGCNFQTSILFRRKSTGQYLCPTHITRVIVNGIDAMKDPLSVPEAEELKFEVSFKEASVCSTVAFTLSLESQGKPDSRGLLSFGPPQSHSWARCHAPISHLPIFCFSSREEFDTLNENLQHVSAISSLTDSMDSKVSQGLYFTLKFQVEKKPRKFLLNISQPLSSLSSSLPEHNDKHTSDQIPLHLISSPKPTSKHLREERNIMFGECLEKLLGEGLKKKGKERGMGRGRGAKRLDVDRSESERVLKKFYTKMKKQYPEEFPELERGLQKIIREEKKKVGGGKVSKEVLHHAMLVVMCCVNS